MTSRILERVSIAYVVAATLTLVYLILSAAWSRGDDDRTRRARVALALAAGPGGAEAVTLAPPPRPAAARPKDYASGYREATRDGKPLVVYVGTAKSAEVPGAVVAKVDAPEFAGAKGPAVVVGYPSGGRVLVDAVLPAPADPAELEKVVKTAGKKIENISPAKLPAAPKPLDWQIRGPSAAPACET